MREILFRGQTIYKSKGNAWYKGSLITESEGAKIVYDTTDENGWEYVIPETVGQYTGLDDKNGNKIFEGDIIKDLKTFEVYEVVFECGQFDCIRTKCDGSFYFNQHELSWHYPDEIEIIGNIYDTPELMGEGELK